MSETHFSLTWDKFHSNMCTGFSLFQQNGEMVDLTLAADGHIVKVHQIILGIASPYLKELIQSVDCKHPVIFMNDMSYKTLCSILEYIYTGQVSIEEEEFPAFFRSAKTLQIRGLEEMYSNYEENKLSSSQNNSGALITTPVKKYRIEILGNDTTNVNEVQLTKPDFVHTRATISRAEFKKETKMSRTVEEKSLLREIESPEIQEEHLDEDFDSGTLEADERQEPFFKNDDEFKTIQPDLSYTVSNKGSLQLILNRYMYNLHSRKPGRIKRWGCVDNRQNNCPAVVFTENNIVIRRLKLHNHPYHDNKIRGKIAKKAVYSAYKAAENSLTLAPVKGQRN